MKGWLHLLLKDHDLSYCNCSDLCIFVYTCAFTYTSIHVSVYVQRYTGYIAKCRKKKVRGKPQFILHLADFPLVCMVHLS